MKIANLMFGKNLGGLEQVALDYHFNLNKNNHQILTILRNGAALNVDKLKKDEVKYISTAPLISSLKIKSYLNRFKPDIVLAHGKRALSYVKTMNTNCPKVFIAHNFRSKSDCLNMDHCIAVSKPVKDHLASLGFPTEKIHVIHNMTDMQQVNFDTELKTPPIFGIIARLHKNKGIDIALHAINAFIKKGHNAKLIIAGSGPEEDELKQLTKELSLEKHVEFIGWTTNKVKFYSSIDIFLLPSRVEPFGITVIEAMASGTPMIISDCEGPSTFVSDQKEAIIVPKEDPIALCENMERLINNHSLRQKMQATQIASSKQYSTTTITNKLEKELDNIIQLDN